MTREVRAPRPLLARVAEFSPAEAAEAAEILELLRDTDDVDELTDYLEPHPPIVYRVTLGEHVAVSWRTTPTGVAIGTIERYRPPPADMP